MDESSVSIIVPVFNRAGMAAEAVASALRAAEGLDVEVIVVDDGSDVPPEPFGDSRVRLLRLERNGGQSAARNHGLDAARGAYVKFLDSDDLLLPGHLAEEVRAIADADIVVSGWISDSVPSEAPHFGGSIVDDVLAGVAVPTSAALYRRRSDWRWDPSLRKLDDWDFFCQAALGAMRIVTVPGAAYVMRHHGGARATDAGMLANAREHHRILHKIEERLAAEGRLTEERKRRLAQYYYKELRVLCLHDAEAFEAALRHIETLDPRFRPRDEEREWWMRGLARLLGVRATIRLHTALKRALR